MKGSSEKEKVLKLLRSALLDKEDEGNGTFVASSCNYYPLDDEPIMVFAEKFVSGKGKFVYCESEEEFIGKLKNLRAYRQWNKIVAFSPSLQTYLSNYEIHTEIDDENTTVGIGLCHSLIARTGSIILTSAQGVGKHLKHFPPIMIVVAFESQIQDSYKQTLEQLSETPPQWLLSIKTGELIEEEIRELYMFVISG
ncbi:MAG: hypothetical protein U0K83_07185 [Bacteroidales bacterium]|jgi:L-lactate dehydrogenase complex protein LldG|nr:hypothetical protein [Bacteroidales bacterium]